MMIKPALIMTWARHLDYPICRYNLNRFKNYFSSIWIGFSDHHQEDDLSNFVRANLPFCNFVDVKRTGDDWRDDVVNSLIKQVANEKYMLFLEQDFLIKDGSFFEKVFEKEHDFIYFNEDGRIHPAFAVVKKELVDKTSKDFSAVPPGDHFYKFFNELPIGINLEELGVKKREDFYHMAGLSQNYMNFKYGDPFYHPNNFLFYNYKCLSIPDKHPKFDQIQQQIERFYGHPVKHAFLNKFFPEI